MFSKYITSLLYLWPSTAWPFSSFSLVALFFVCISLNTVIFLYSSISLLLFSSTDYSFIFQFWALSFFFQVSSSLSEKTDGRYYKYRMQRDSVQQRRDDTRYRIKSLKVMFFIQFWKLGSLTISKSIQLISSCVSVCVRVLGKGKIPLDFTVITACRLSIEMNTT